MLLSLVLSIIIASIIYITYEYIKHVFNLKNYPPGPFPYPLIGNIHLLSRSPHKTFSELAKVYGNVFSISLGMQRVVIVNSIKPAREALIGKGDQFSGRPNNHYIVGIISRGFKDLVFADYGPLWIHLRKLGIFALKMQGLRLNKLSDNIIKESEELRNRLREKEGKIVSVEYEFGTSIINIIATIVFGERYHPDDPELRQIIDVNKLIASGFSNGDLVAFLPWLRYFPSKSFSDIKKGISIRDPLVRRKVAQHKLSFDHENIRDFTDSLIQLSRDKEKIQNAGIKEFTDDHIEMIVSDMFGAGSETTLTTIEWFILFMLHWPRFQDEMYEQIMAVVGPYRYPGLEDRSALSLVQAVIQETLRFASLSPLGVPHKAVVNSSIDGKTIPKGTQVIFNIWSFHNDENYWENPEIFDPYRWFDDENVYTPGRHLSFLPFSTGRRVCLGESMAKAELFLFFSRLVRDFRIEPIPYENLPTLEGKLGITLCPSPVKALFKSRGNFS